MSTLDEFKSALTNIVRPNRFRVMITPPVSIAANVIDSENLRFWVKSASLPDRAFNEIIMKFHGMEYKIPAGEILQDLNITFYVDHEWDNRNLFETWADLINNRSNNVKGYAQDLFDGSSVTVSQLDFNNNTIAKYKFYHIFPKTVDQIELDMDTTDSAETFNVTFCYSYSEQITGE